MLPVLNPIWNLLSIYLSGIGVLEQSSATQEEEIL